MEDWKCVFTCALVFLLCFSSVRPEKLRFCTVDGRGGFKKAGRYCPLLEQPSSNVECVLGVDRMDCLRRISKGTVDFSVFSAEDLVAAVNSDIDVLITNELRFTNDDFEYEVVAVIDNKAGINSRYDLHDKRLCHPGYGYESDWTGILANFFESSIVPQTCNTAVTLTENRISASSKFFKAACKAGPWVHDPVLDYQLKLKYSNLCALCGSPATCSTKDKYWGRRGPLYCLTDRLGDATWSRLDDVQSHFGLDSGSGMSDPDDFSFLCPDGKVKPLNVTKPCVWVVKPWPVIATKRTSAQDVQRIISSLTHDNKETWKSALLDLIETYHITIHTLNPIDGIETFLDRATGFLSANSFSGCHPPRTIRMCTTSNIENTKCAWIREAAAVYGVEPDIDCIKADNTTHCMQAINDKAADVVIVPPDLVNRAISEFNLKTLFYETVNEEDKYITVAVVRKTNTKINKLEDLEGKKACFPVYDGVAWNSVVHHLKKKHLLNACPFTDGLSQFFAESCVPDLPKDAPRKLKENCRSEKYRGDTGALNCLNDRAGDVAFVSRNSLNKFLLDARMNKVSMDEFKIVCVDAKDTDNCHLGWATVGQGMVSVNNTEMWIKDSLDVFQQLDNMFGKDFKTITRPVTMYNLFNGKSNILFHDATVRLRNVPTAKNTDKMPKHYEEILSSGKTCSIVSSSPSIKHPSLFILCLMMFNYFSAM